LTRASLPRWVAKATGSEIDTTIYGGSKISRLPEALHSPAVVARWLATDVADRALGRRDALTPPEQLQNVGEGDFGAVGETFVHYLQMLAGLHAGDRVLDIGCGIGRVARVLARELRPPGSYDGFDIVSTSIDWCSRHYRSTPAPFRFKHSDIHNTTYNPQGTISAADYRFPYPDNSFDLVVAVSLFTHLVPESASHYLAEAARVLAPGGRMLLTWFLLTDTPPPHPKFDFKATDGPASVVAPENPEAAIAFPETWLRERLNENGLAIREPIQWGNWRGIQNIPYQDIVVVGPAA
jgi:SAM-dependent methyltransferase